MNLRFGWKLVAMLLLIATLATALPLSIIAENIQADEESEQYIKSIKLAQAKSKDEAKKLLEDEGYIFLDGNLNAGTGEDGVWMGYTTTSDPNEAIYDMKVMNTKGGYTLTSVEDALQRQETALAAMAADLELLVEDFVLAYEEGSVPAQKAYMTLNFFRMVEGETELAEENGLGYQIVHGGMTTSKLTEMIMLCDPDLVDSVVKILTTGIQVRNANWMEQLSLKGPYDSEIVYGEDEAEIKRRAEQLLIVLQFYAEAYNAMDKSGLIPDSFDDNFEPQYNESHEAENLPAEEAEIKKIDEARYKMYKIVFDELAKYSYGSTGDTLKDFFCSLATEGNAKKLYPLVSVLSDGEFAALSYGCFLEVAMGAGATTADFDSYDEVYAELTEEVKSVYLYTGVDKALLGESTVIGFTEAASRHMASTGELEFYEKESRGEDVWETGQNVAKAVGAMGMAVIGLAKITFGTTMLISTISTTVATSVKSGMLAGLMKFCTVISGGYATLIVAAVALVIALISYLIMLDFESDDNEIDWENNPIPEYLYDVKEVSFRQTSTNDGIATETLKRPVFAFYEVVTDVDGKAMDLNAFSDDASQWIALYVSRDKQGDDAKPIKAKDLLVQTGNGEIPEDYVPLSAFGKVIAYDLNQWDEDDDVNGVYLFYKQDAEIAVESNVTYYIYDVYLQVGESDAHCIDLLQAAGYTPLNVNLSPSLTDGGLIFEKPRYTYLGYKLTTNPSSAIRDLRVVYGPSQGEIKLGGSTYAECGSNGLVTLYATKYKSAGTPILGGGLQVVTDRADAATGYEPVNLFSGGPAVSLNVLSEGLRYDTPECYLYFLPETTFTEGTAYLGGITYMKYQYQALLEPLHALGGGDEEELLKYLQEKIGWEYTGDYMEQWLQNGGRYIPIDDYQTQISTVQALVDYKLGYDYAVILQNKFVPRIDADREDMWDSVLYTETYNPYRAIYDLKGTTIGSSQQRLTLESVGYLSWTRAVWVFHNNLADDIANIDPHFDKTYLTINQQDGSADVELGSRLFVTGNPSGSNVYDANKKAMTEKQPIRLSDFQCVAESSDIPLDLSALQAVGDVFTDSKDAIVFKNGDSKVAFRFYFVSNTEVRPYVSAITAIDKKTLKRAYGDSIRTNQITDGMLLTQLASQGATNFCGLRVKSLAYDYDSTYEINAVKFGYTRSDTASEALRDVFLYFNGFSNDEPPKELYRGAVKYTLLCEIPYNYTGYESAPIVGAYLYGTTDSRAGNRIIDFTVSEKPFLDGYETVRTMDGGSLISEILAYVERYGDSHMFDEAQDMFDQLKEFFTIKDKKEKREHGIFYLHVKREGDSIREQKPYVEQLYVVCSENGRDEALEQLFHMGAEDYIEMDFNEYTYSGNVIYIGYSYTADPNEAITEIRAYHKKNPPATLTDEGGYEYQLASDVDLNKGAGGKYIYLYTSKEQDLNYPITNLSAGYNVRSAADLIEWSDGTYVSSYLNTTRIWGSDSYSDMNKGAFGKYIYLMYTNVNVYTAGTYKDKSYGSDKTFTRKEITGTSATGKYIAALYVMDKNTLRQEKLAAGIPSADCTCDKIPDREVFERLEQMGATTIIETPIQVSGGEYGKNNPNKVFIGYSRTNNVKNAIRNIAIKVELLSLAEPAETIEIDKKSYKLVAEAAKKVTELPRAINLIGVEDGQDMLIPRMYLYYSTAGTTEPIYDLCIDADPIKNDWSTVRSANKLDPFADVYAQAFEQYTLAKQDVKDYFSSCLVYTKELKAWMEDVMDLFDPEDAEAKPFYIHCKKFETETLEQAKPYIGEVFLAKGDSRHEALSQLVAFDPDGFIDVDLNRDAGGDYVYVAYKRVEKAKDALRDIVVFQGKNPAATKRLEIGSASSVKYTLVADVDLNSDAGGEYLYLYTSDSSSTGNPITGLRVEDQTDAYLKCGVEHVTVKVASGKVITDEMANLIEGATILHPEKRLYMIMERQTTEGHNKSPDVQTLHKDPTCGEEGHDTVISHCLDCGARLEDVTAIPATGEHYDADNDGNHSCDVCGKKNLTTHVRGEAQEQDRIEATEEQNGSYKVVYYCTECHTKLSESKVVIPAGTETDRSALGASVFGEGSVIAVCSFAAFAGIAAAIIYFVKKRKQGENQS